MKNIVIIILFSATAFAGQERSGGNALVCFSDPRIPARIRSERAMGGPARVRDSEISSITKVEILDLFEVKTQRASLGAKAGPRLVPVVAHETAVEFVERIKRRVQYLMPSFYQSLTMAQTRLQTIKEFPHGLDVINDVGPGMNLETSLCARVTIIGHYEQGGEEFIGNDSRIFNLPAHIHSDFSKNVALLHEYVYYVIKSYQLPKGQADISRDIVALLLKEDLWLNELAPKYKEAMQVHIYGISPLIYTSQILRNLRGTAKNILVQSEFDQGKLRESKFEQACEKKKIDLRAQLQIWYRTEGLKMINSYPDIPDNLRLDIAQFLEASVVPVNGIAYKGKCRFVFPPYMHERPYNPPEMDDKFLRIKIPVF